MSETNKRQLRCSFCGKPIDEVARATERDNFMGPEEAKAFGLIDEVLVKRKPEK